MPYRGKPSTACERCRARRLKCNRTTPCCASCDRAGVPCPGYRNLLDLGFRDQTVAVTQTCQNATPKKRQARPSHPKTSSDIAMTAASPSMGHSLGYSISETAKGNLFSRYAASDRRGNGEVACMLRFATDSTVNSTLNAAIDAIALAALGNVRLSPQVLLKAQRRYTAALSQTNQALSDPKLCRRDDTLRLVVLLSIYEVITCTGNSFMNRWVVHLEGATKLLEVRGLEQLRGREGLDLFTQLRAQISLSRISQEKYSPPILAQLTEQAAPYRDAADEILDQVASVVIQLTNLCADVKHKVITDLKLIVSLALHLDSELVSLLMGTPKCWRYRSVDVPLVAGQPITRTIQGGSYHVYEKLTAAKLWNSYRSARIVIQELVIDTIKLMGTSSASPGGQVLPDVDDYHVMVANQSRHTIKQLVLDICASVPFHLGSQVSDDDEGTGGTADSGLALLWPLLIAANSGVASNDVRSWIVTYFDKIGHSMGINQALAMATMIRGNTSTRTWLEASLGPS